MEKRQGAKTEAERFYKSTIAAASAVDISGDIGDRLAEGAAYIAKYFQGGQKFKVSCGVAKATKYFVF